MRFWPVCFGRDRGGSSIHCERRSAEGRIVLNMFGTAHIAVLIGTLILVPAVCMALKKTGRDATSRFLKCCAVIILFFDPAYWLWEAVNFRHFNFSTTLPLYICSLFWILMPFAAFARRDKVRQTACACICTVCLMGGILGLVFCVYLNRYPFFSFVPLRSLAYHVIMVLSAAVMWTTGYYRPQPQDRYRCFIPVDILLMPCLVLNKLYGWDYFYTAGGVGTPLARMSAAMPKGVFLLVLYGGLLLIIQVIFYYRFYLISLENAEKRRISGQPLCAPRDLEKPGLTSNSQSGI